MELQIATLGDSLAMTVELQIASLGDSLAMTSNSDLGSTMYVRGGWVYITTNRPNGVLYVGVTSNLIQRIHQHKTKHYPDSFSAQYNVDKLVYFEEFGSIVEAIAREKQLKAGSRAKKVALIEKRNPTWRDLYAELVGEG